VKHRFSPTFIILGVVLSFMFATANTPPVASFEVLASADGSQATMILDATASHDPDGTVVTYQWSYGDNSTGSGVTKTHTFPTVSTFTIMLVVTDNGGASHWASQTIDLTQPIVSQTPPGEAAVPNDIVRTIVIPYDIPIGIRSGERAPAFALPNQAGEIVELADFLGHVVLVEFWTSSCSACRAAMPHLEALRDEFEDRGLVVITITINRNADGRHYHHHQSECRGGVAVSRAERVYPIHRPSGVRYHQKADKRRVWHIRHPTRVPHRSAGCDLFRRSCQLCAV